MEEQSHKSYYAIIPANVRYDKDLPSNAKLLYGEITALCNEKGFCWALNSYFAKLYEVHETTISRWISSLKARGYIRIEYRKIYESDVTERRLLYISDGQMLRGVSKNAKGVKQKCKAPLSKNAKHNNTTNNTSNTTTTKSDDVVDSGLSQCIEAFENNIHPLTGIIERDTIIELYEKYHELWFVEAVKVAALNHGRSVSYIMRVLENWERNGFKAEKKKEPAYQQYKRPMTDEDVMMAEGKWY